MIYLRTSVGIEMRQEDLLISCLQSNLSGGVFTHFARIANFRSRDKDEVRSEISRFFKSHGLGRDNIVLGIPRKDLIIRHLDLPAEVADNLKQVVQYQVQSFEPTEDDRFQFDYALLKSNQGSKRLLILLAMIRKSILDAHLNTLGELGIRPVSVTGTTVGLSNMFLQTCNEPANKTFILADLTSDGIEIMALRDGALVYTRAAATTEGAAYKDVLVREVEDAAGKIRLGPDEVIERFVLNGDACESMQQDLAEVIPDSELLGNRIRFEMTPESKSHLHEAVTSLGLAYTGMVRRPAMKLNLLPQEMRVQQTRWAYVPSIIMGLVVVVLLCVFFLRPIIQDRILLRKLDEEIQTLKPRVERVQAVRTQYERLEKRINFIEGLLRNRDMNLDVLQELTNLLPADSFLNQYQYQDGTITLAGSSPAAEALLPKLEKSPLLKDVLQRGTMFKDAQTGKDRFNFTAKLER